MPIINKQDLTTSAGVAPGLEVCELVSAAQGSQSLHIEEVTVAPNARIPRRINPHTEAAIIVLEGTLDAATSDAGTPAYMAPELKPGPMGGRRVEPTAAADILCSIGALSVLTPKGPSQSSPSLSSWGSRRPSSIPHRPTPPPS